MTEKISWVSASSAMTSLRSYNPSNVVILRTRLDGHRSEPFLDLSMADLASPMMLAILAKAALSKEAAMWATLR